MGDWFTVSGLNLTAGEAISGLEAEGAASDGFGVVSAPDFYDSLFGGGGSSFNRVGAEYTQGRIGFLTTATPGIYSLSGNLAGYDFLPPQPGGPLNPVQEVWDVNLSGLESVTATFDGINGQDVTFSFASANPPSTAPEPGTSWLTVLAVMAMMPTLYPRRRGRPAQR